jgi:hypothetical protein
MERLRPLLRFVQRRPYITAGIGFTAFSSVGMVNMFQSLKQQYPDIVLEDLPSSSAMQKLLADNSTTARASQMGRRTEDGRQFMIYYDAASAFF